MEVKLGRQGISEIGQGRYVEVKLVKQGIYKWNWSSILYSVKFVQQSIYSEICAAKCTQENLCSKGSVLIYICNRKHLLHHHHEQINLS